MSEPHLTAPDIVLDGVQADDRANVRNIIHLLHTFKLCTSWSVTPSDGVYEIVGILDAKRDIEVALEDLELIQKVDPLRILFVGVRVHPGSQVFTLRVKVLAMSQPIMIQEQEIVRIQRKRRWWGRSS
jgi:hypothetical protein